MGAGYNIFPVWAGRMRANTLIPTPNADVIYAMSYLDLKADGPLVVEVPAGIQGLFDDFWQEYRFIQYRVKMVVFLYYRNMC